MIKAKKRFGQNFLIDKNIINKIVDELDLLEDSLVIEIGPGYGALTKELVLKAKHVLAYEIDRDCVASLRENIKTPNFEVVESDILEANIKSDIAKYQVSNVYIIGNLPYYITTAILIKLIEEKLDINKYVFMVQEEVADRYTSLSNNKEYNSLTVYLNYLFNTKKCFIVKNTSFDPVPKVTSAVISLTKKDILYKPISEDYFYYINKLIFKQKRKTIINNIKDNFESNIINTAFNNLGLKLTARAEELSIKDIIDLSDELFKLSNIYEKAYAKINLSLRVLDKNTGYHDINSLMAKIDLSDELVFIKSKEDKVISNIDIEDNVILKTIKLFKEKYKIREGVTIYLKKNIPLSAGLAGGSSDSSATLRGLNRLFCLNKKLSELEDLAKVLGSDNVYTLYQNLATCKGRGEIIDLIDIKLDIPILIINPNFGLSTKSVYDNYLFEDKIDTTIDILEALKVNNIIKLEEYIFNDLEKPALKDEKYLAFYNSLKDLNIKTYQSGSGPTRYSFEIDKKDVLKEKMNNLLIIQTKIIN